MILLVLAMMLTVFAVACGNDAKPATESEDSRTLDDADDDVEAARGSDNAGAYNYDNITFDDWQNIAEPDDDASFRGTAIDKDSLVKKDGN